ncbi:hypothetical protein IFM89_028389 [Coptis chinensis]|uniref:Uncharacterized protein n=1 Tax=Coptis chinensis TaxID=261450 RepID=A0A835H882_9MAGN|nr:hypothetical protein IFM89_028389 [Coptis chinensis]
MLSCYDAELCYDCFTDTFQARYPSHYSRTPVIEQCVHWDRIRAPPVDIPPHNVHASDCLDKLHPGTMLRFSGEETKNFLMGGGMVLLVTWRLAMRLEVSAVVIRAPWFTVETNNPKQERPPGSGRSRGILWWNQETSQEGRNLCVEASLTTPGAGHLRLWRLFVSVFAFSSTPEWMFGLVKFYLFDFGDPSLNMLASGPYGLIFSSFVPFYFDIPVSISTQFHIFGINFSDKSFVYLAGLQVSCTFYHRGKDLFCQEYVVFLPVFSIVPIFFGICMIKFPEFVSSLFSRLSWPTLGGSSPSASSGNVIGNVAAYTGREMEASTASISVSFVGCSPVSALLEEFFYSPLVLDSILLGLVPCLRLTQMILLGFVNGFPREIILPLLLWLLPWSHLTIRSQHWFQWALTGTQQDRHLYRSETTSMWLQTSFLKHNLTNSNPGQ